MQDTKEVLHSLALSVHPMETRSRSAAAHYPSDSTLHGSNICGTYRNIWNGNVIRICINMRIPLLNKSIFHLEGCVTRTPTCSTVEADYKDGHRNLCGRISTLSLGSSL